MTKPSNNCSTNSGIESSAEESLCGPWAIEPPAKRKPPPGEERLDWLAHRQLYRMRADIFRLLAAMDPDLPRNHRITTLDEDAVATQILAVIEPAAPALPWSARETDLLLRYLQRSFREYTRMHGLNPLRLPYTEQFGLESSFLEAGLPTELDRHTKICDEVIGWLKQNLQGYSHHANSLDPIDAVALVLACAGAFGGLDRSQFREAIGRALTQDPSVEGQLLWYELKNPIDFRWIPDPVSQGWLRRLYARGCLPLAAALDHKTLENRLRQKLGPGFELAMRAGQLKAFSGEVTSVLRGQVQYTPLADEPWRRLLTGRRASGGRQRVALQRPARLPSIPARSPHERVIAEALESIELAVRFNASDRSTTHSSGQIGRAYRLKLQQRLGEIEMDLRAKFTALGMSGREIASFPWALIAYTRELVTHGGARRAELAPGTINGYVMSALRELQSMHFSDLEQQRVCEREAMYRQALDHCPMPGPLRSILERFEYSLVRSIDVEDTVEWVGMRGWAPRERKSRADANLVEPALYRHAWSILIKRSEIEPWAQLAAVMLLILFRFGLRASEAIELSVGAIRFQAPRSVTVSVKTSRWSTLKSANAKRDIGPFELPQDEFDQLCLVVEKTEIAAGANPDASLFAIETEVNLEYALGIRAAVMALLRELAGDPNLRVRHLRHSFLSLLFIQGRCPQDLPGMQEQHSVIEPWRRAFLAGHSAPDVSLTSYIHTVELLHWQQACTLIGNTVQLDTLEALSGCAHRTQERKFHRRGVSPSGLDRAIATLKALHRNIPLLRSRTRPAGISYPNLLSVQAVPPPLREGNRSAEQLWQTFADTISRRASPSDVDAALMEDRLRPLVDAKRINYRHTRRPQFTERLRELVFELWRLAGDEEAHRAIDSAVAALPLRNGLLILPTNQEAGILYKILHRAGMDVINQKSKQGQAALRLGETETLGNKQLELIFVFLHCCGFTQSKT